MYSEKRELEKEKCTRIFIIQRDLKGKKKNKTKADSKNSKAMDAYERRKLRIKGHKE